MSAGQARPVCGLQGLILRQAPAAHFLSTTPERDLANEPQNRHLAWDLRHLDTPECTACSNCVRVYGAGLLPGVTAVKHRGTMPLEARALVPSADHPQTAYLAFDDAAEPQLTIYDVAEDSLPTEDLAAAFLRKGRRPIWLRLGPQARDRGGAFRCGKRDVGVDAGEARPRIRLAISVRRTGRRDGWAAEHGRRPR